VLASYGGTYQFSDYRLAIAVEGSHFVAKFDDGAAMVFFAEWETKFSSKAWDTRFEFSKNNHRDVGL
jgi:hypothetical protein